ncbi:MAG: hypothetical protein JEZ08_17795 [Clostridiales bacterium]|nr:hypothetical protein [Clostridiales bacterium]
MMKRRTVAGINYGYFLGSKYKTLLGLRANIIILIMAMIQCYCSVSLCMDDTSKHWMNDLLLLNAIILLSYFIFYIIIKNPRVKREILKAHFLGLYYDSDEIPELKADLVTNMSNGNCSKKILSDDILDYFETITPETLCAFDEIFGPSSILYNRSGSIKRFYKRHYAKKPYDYSTTSGLSPLSHEFFLLFQNNHQQETYALEILRLFNTTYTKNFSDQKIDNLIRLMAHINECGNESILGSTKFLNQLTDYLVEAIEGEPHRDMISYREVKEVFLIKEVFGYISKSLSAKEDKIFYVSAVNLNNRLHTSKGYIGHFNYKNHIGEIMKAVYNEKNNSTKQFSEKVLDDYKALYSFQLMELLN